jgi:hypothetical protein
VEALACGSEGDFDRELLLVRILHNLVSLGKRLRDDSADSGLSDLQGAGLAAYMHVLLVPLAAACISHCILPTTAFSAGRLSQAAGSMLQNDWQHCPALASSKAKAGATPGWRGRTASMATLVRDHIENDCEPLQLLLSLARLLLEDPMPASPYAGPSSALPMQVALHAPSPITNVGCCHPQRSAVPASQDGTGLFSRCSCICGRQTHSSSVLVLQTQQQTGSRSTGQGCVQKHSLCLSRPPRVTRTSRCAPAPAHPLGNFH